MDNETRFKLMHCMMATSEAHWRWLEEILHLVYVDAMVHGYKHRLDEEELERKEL